MKKQLTGSLVGAAILFLWQFLSWSILPVHQSEYGYTPNQDKILEALNQNLTEAGTYMVPGMPPGTSHEESAKAMEGKMGQPWASITYHKSFNANMGMNMLRGFLVDAIAAFLLIWLLMKTDNPGMQTTVLSCMAIGVIGYLTIPYLNSIWFETKSLGYLVDALVSWGLVGVWLGWWLPRN